MKSLARLSLLLLAGAHTAAAQEPPPGDGPRGTSELAAGETRYDIVGYAVRGDLPGVSASVQDVPAGSYAEITALDSGRTIVVAMVDDDAPMTRLVMLSGPAATALGMGDGDFAVRLRKVSPTPQDVVQLREGGAAPSRADAPPAVLAALRKKLPPVATRSHPLAKVRRAQLAVDPVAKPPTRGKPAPAKIVTSGYVLQVAALSSAERAAVVADAVGGAIVPGPPLWRVRLGPYRTLAAATRARDDAARRGYPGGQITRIP